jgi:hypothetical protein
MRQQDYGIHCQVRSEICPHSTSLKIKFRIGVVGKNVSAAHVNIKLCCLLNSLLFYHNCCLIPERVFTVLCCSRSGKISCIYIPKIIYIIFNGYMVLKKQWTFLMYNLKAIVLILRVLSEGNLEFWSSISYELNRRARSCIFSIFWNFV